MNHLIVIVLAIITSASLSWADAHSGWGGKSYSKSLGDTVTPGKTGTLIHSSTSDVWDWSEAPEGWPMAVTATCHQTNVISPENTHLFGRFICESVDGDGDISIWLGTWDGVNNIGTGKILFGTGKYENVKMNDFTIKPVEAISSDTNILAFSN